MHKDNKNAFNECVLPKCKIEDNKRIAQARKRESALLRNPEYTYLDGHPTRRAERIIRTFYNGSD